MFDFKNREALGVRFLCMGSSRGWWVRAELFKSDMSVFEEQPALACQLFPLSEPQSPSLYNGDKAQTSDYYNEQYVMQNRVQ